MYTNNTKLTQLLVFIFLCVYCVYVTRTTKENKAISLRGVGEFEGHGRGWRKGTCKRLEGRKRKGKR